jgi:hypothetical protein
MRFMHAKGIIEHIAKKIIYWSIWDTIEHIARKIILHGDFTNEEI